MAPILIDARGLFKLGSTAIVLTALIFFGGFFTGYEKASEFYLVSSENHPLSLPDVAESIAGSRNPLTPDNVEVGENIDVDRPEANLSVAEAAEAGDNIGFSAASDTGQQKQEALVLASKVINPQTKSMDIITGGIANSEDGNMLQNAIVDVSPADIKNAKYSIQLGMYGNLINAENMKNMLLAQKFRVYISEYKNKKDETRYNVRVGYFADKSSALSSLNLYRKLGKGDGYLVMFSAENMLGVVNVRDEATLSSAIDEPQSKELVTQEREKQKAESAAATNINNLSQVDIINTTSAVTY